jgi:hypothetical protein
MRIARGAHGRACPWSTCANAYAEPPGENAVRGHLVADQPRLSVPVR